MSDHQRNGISPLSAAVFGAITAAAAMFLSKPENRKKLQDGLERLWSTGEEEVKRTKKTVHQLKEKVKEGGAEEMERAAK